MFHPVAATYKNALYGLVLVARLEARTDRVGLLAAVALDLVVRAFFVATFSLAALVVGTSAFLFFDTALQGAQN